VSQKKGEGTEEVREQAIGNVGKSWKTW